MNPFTLETLRQIEIRRLRDVASLHGFELVGKRKMAAVGTALKAIADGTLDDPRDTRAAAQNALYWYNGSDEPEEEVPNG